jgi:hypothetical protein
MASTDGYSNVATSSAVDMLRRPTEPAGKSASLLRYEMRRARRLFVGAFGAGRLGARTASDLVKPDGPGAEKNWWKNGDEQNRYFFQNIFKKGRRRMKKLDEFLKKIFEKKYLKILRNNLKSHIKNWKFSQNFSKSHIKKLKIFHKPIQKPHLILKPRALFFKIWQHYLFKKEQFDAMNSSKTSILTQHFLELHFFINTNVTVRERKESLKSEWKFQRTLGVLGPSISSAHKKFLFKKLLKNRTKFFPKIENLAVFKKPLEKRIKNGELKRWTNNHTTEK